MFLQEHSPALPACAPDALVLADARAPALFACDPDSLVLADARAPAILACAPPALVLADARPPDIERYCGYMGCCLLLQYLMDP